MSVEQPVTRLRIDHWDRPVDQHDAAILSRCVGPTLDVGCGPGRFTAGLAERGHVVLGIDVVPSAVSSTRDRGGAALRRDVFGDLPGEGRWGTALLADGNLGIGGDPVALLGRLRTLLDPRGRVVAEVAEPGTEAVRDYAAVEHGGATQVVPWAVVGMDGIDAIVDRAGFAVVDRLECCSRWCVVLAAAA
ncbi:MULTISPECIES: class I SAM-dependent methyltransferase [Nocardioides]|uniref:class I SAM-dependent methyltransferase n=1 Tax=Nocardioides TaxID=1839 RepID=UPI002867D009|nr:methyltransferase domain-containing protein [Nocardioides sp. CGMCC 1.13656]